MIIALFGYAGTGKTSLFEILSQKKTEIRHHQEGRIELPKAVCQVPDERLDWLCSVYPEKKKVPVHLELVDFPGISAGEISTNQYIAQLRQVDGLVHVVRSFQNPAVTHPRGHINPVDDIRAMMEELILSDLVMITGRLEKLEKDLKKLKDTEAEREKALLEKIKPWLEEGRTAQQLQLTPSEEKMIRGFCLLSLKPVLHLINLDEKQLAFLDHPEELLTGLQPDLPVSAFCGKIEKEILELEEEERALFQGMYGLTEPTASRFFKKLYEVMGLIHFYTIGKEEVRAWVIRKNTPALKAAGEIHSDIEKGFIRAEVLKFNDLQKYGSWNQAREAGAIHLEGKNYPVQDGDIIYFRFNP
ncbi:MAG: redox-regulated ATPase YchF [Candidatus Aminicenantes bacterium]|nr:redox-regulated ATPase YchF [Candidatus Aminicenantes bacterium]